MKHCIRAALALALLACLILPASAMAASREPVLNGLREEALAEIRGDEEYVFTGAEFDQWEALRGVFVTELPEGCARLLLGDRVIRAGDVIPEAELSRLRLLPTRDAETEAAIRFLPICGEGPEPEAVFTLHIHSTVDEAPTARDLSLETYRNLPNSGVLKAENDDDGPLTFTLQNHPTRGTVELAPDGRFTYTPRKNKVGEDSFTFTATDAGGHESAPATVRITILTPQDGETFADLDRDAQFTALWLRDNGIFGGEQISGQMSFGPDKPVTRGEFLAMVMELAGLRPEIGLPSSGFADEAEAPLWQRPYLASGLRRGIIRGFVGEQGLEFAPNRPVTGAEAALMLSRTLGLESLRAVSTLESETVPAWAEEAAAVLAETGLPLQADDTILTRQQAADLLYAASRLCR